SGKGKNLFIVSAFAAVIVCRIRKYKPTTMSCDIGGYYEEVSNDYDGFVFDASFQRYGGGCRGSAVNRSRRQRETSERLGCDAVRKAGNGHSASQQDHRTRCERFGRPETGRSQ